MKKTTLHTLIILSLLVVVLLLMLDLPTLIRKYKKWQSDISEIKKEYKVEVSNGVLCSTKKVKEGDTVFFVVKDSIGYDVIDIKANGKQLGKDTSYVIMPNHDLSIVAVYKQIITPHKYKITCLKGISCDKSEAFVGDVIHFSISNPKNDDFYYLINGTNIGKQTSYVMSQGDVSIDIIYKGQTPPTPLKYKINCHDGIICDKKEAITGETIHFSLPNPKGPDYYFTLNGYNIGKKTTYTVQQCNVDLKVKYKAPPQPQSTDYIWEGNTYKGKPSGKGKMTILKHFCYYPKKSFYGNAGDVIEGYFDNGIPYNATHKNKTGKLIRTINELEK